MTLLTISTPRKHQQKRKAAQMPKLRKEETEDMDVAELEAAEYSDEQFSKYGGDVPPNDTILRAKVSKMWWSRTNAGDPMLVALVEADENEGLLGEYNGLPCWERMSLTTGAKFKWAPFLEHFGLSIRDVKGKIILESDEDDSIGAPIVKIDKFAPGSEDAWCRIIIQREKYNDNWQAHVAGWLPYDEDEEPQDADEELEDEDDDLEDEDDAEDEEAEESVPVVAKRGRQPARSASKAAAAPAATPTRAAGRKPAPAASAPARARQSRTATAAKPAPAPARRGRRPATEDNEPPF